VKRLPLETSRQIQNITDKRESFGTWRKRQVMGRLTASTPDADAKHEKERKPAGEKVELHLCNTDII
jgi:hypothetical protein